MKVKDLAAHFGVTQSNVSSRAATLLRAGSHRHSSSGVDAVTMAALSSSGEGIIIAVCRQRGSSGRRACVSSLDDAATVR